MAAQRRVLRPVLGAGEKPPRRTRLVATTLEAARKEMAKVRQDRDGGDLPNRGHKPFYAEFAREYIEFLKLAVQNQRRSDTFHKSPATVRKEAGNLERWIEHTGPARIDQITRTMVAFFIEKRLTEGSSPRTANLDVIMLRNVLKRALDAGHTCKRSETDATKPYTEGLFYHQKKQHSEIKPTMFNSYVPASDGLNC